MIFSKSRKEKYSKVNILTIVLHPHSCSPQQEESYYWKMVDCDISLQKEKYSINKKVF